MKKQLLELLVVAVITFIFTIGAWGFGPPSIGEQEVVEKSEVKNVTLITANLFDGLSYKDSNGNSGVYRDLTEIHPPYKASIKDVINKKIPVNIKYEHTRTYTGRFWKHDNVIELSLASKTSKDVRPAKKKKIKKH
jgi:hypothetical protein